MAHQPNMPVQHAERSDASGAREPVTPTTVLAWVGVSLAVIAVVAVVATRTYRRATEELRVERGWRATPADTQRVRDAQAEKLSQYAVVDAAKGIVTIPIQRAMKLVVDEAAARGGEAPR